MISQIQMPDALLSLDKGRATPSNRRLLASNRLPRASTRVGLCWLYRLPLLALALPALVCSGESSYALLDRVKRWNSEVNIKPSEMASAVRMFSEQDLLTPRKGLRCNGESATFFRCLVILIILFMQAIIFCRYWDGP